MALTILNCEPGKALDPTQPAGNNDTDDVVVPGRIAKLTALSVPGQILPGDTADVQVFLEDSSTQNPLAGAKITVTSSRFTLLNGSDDEALNLDTVPVDGKVGFRITSNSPGEGSVILKVTAGPVTRNFTLNITVTEKPVAPKIVESYPQAIMPGDTADLMLTVLDSAKEAPMSKAVVTVTSTFFEVASTVGGDPTQGDTTKTNGKLTFKVVSDKAGTGTIQVKVRTAAGLTRSVTLTLTVSETPQTDRPRQMTFTALRSNLKADGSDSTQLKVVVKDDNNNPLQGELIRFSSTGGLVQAEATTDEWGQAFSILLSERINKSVTVTATLVKLNMSAQQKVTFSGVNIQINASKKVIMRDSVVQVTFLLRDASDNPISGDSLQIQVKNAYQGFGATKKDSLVVETDTKGEFHTSITSRNEATVTLTATALGASAQQDVEFTSRTLSLTSNKSSIVGDGNETATLTATLTDGSNNAINGAELRWTTTFGDFTSKPFTSTASGKSSLALRAPSGSGLATVNVEALKDGKLIASGNITIRVRPLAISKLDLKVTPDNIPVRVGEANLIARAYDSAGNVMTGVLIGFKMLKGAGGGDETITPPAVYAENGSATSLFKAGSVISFYRSIRVAAVAMDIVNGDTLVIASSDTVLFTISGPPHRVSIGANILKGINPDDGTFALPAAAVVTDVNGNLVADGTPVNFSVHPVMAHRSYTSWTATTSWPGYLLGDTVYQNLPWGDYNGNGKLEKDEKASAVMPANPARGEDIDGNGVINLAPESFTDINGNGVWDGANAEPIINWYYDTLANRQSFVDFNKNGIRDTIEPFLDFNNDGICQCTGQYDVNGNLYEDNYFGSPLNKPFPGQASIGIDRQVGTVGGKAPTQIIYVQSDALRISVRVRAEANGIESFVDVRLPIILSGN